MEDLFVGAACRRAAGPLFLLIDSGGKECTMLKSLADFD